MNKIEFIKSKFREILSETIDERVKNIEKNLYDEASFEGIGEFDYVQEEKKEMCEVCGGYKGSEMSEEKMCECGGQRYGKMMDSDEKLYEIEFQSELNELGGMNDGHPRFGNKNFAKMSKREKEDLMSDRSYEYSDDFKDEEEEDNFSMRGHFFKDEDQEDEDDFRFNAPSPDYDFEEDEDDFDFDAPSPDYDYEEDEYDDLRIPDDMTSYKTKYRYSDDEEITEKLHGKQHRLDKNKNGKIDSEDFRMLRRQQDEEQLYEVEFEKNDGETEEGNAFTGMLKKTPKGHAFKLGGKKYKDRSSLEEKWKGKDQVKESILYIESDLLDLIESLVIEEKKKFKVSEPKGFKEYERVHKADKKENEDYLKSVAKKMTDYLKKSSDSGSKYEMKKTKKFPTENGGFKKGIRKKYTPSDAVDDYIDAFSYPGQTNLVFDEIKPTQKNIEKYLKGHRTTGNAQVDDDGNALGNVVPSETGDKFFQNFKDNLYGQEQMDASYKRQPQPVDQAGEETERGSLKTKRGKKTSQSVLNKLEESIDEKSEKKLNEEFGRMYQLMGYNIKTQ